ncbi:MAG: type II toxin-antitoxin system RelE/ParE family toxin [Gammaproteobacteria bacterium]|nr:type II toxin-antitoxin system RelE/ParE family toxin [Gammaproteobacteria bacterium]
MYEVLLTNDAVIDLEELDDYISSHDAPENADYVLNRIEEAIQGLSDMLERGRYPRELSKLGMQEYREVFFKPYRIIYRIIDQKVYVFLIADGRRNMQALLQRRLFSASI